MTKGKRKGEEEKVNTAIQAPAQRPGRGKWVRKNKMTPAELEVARRRARKKWQEKQREQGRCIECTRRAALNPATGKPGLRCRLHQDRATEFNRQYTKNGNDN